MRSRLNTARGVLITPPAAIAETAVWRDIPGDEGRYQASSFGQIRRLRHIKLGGQYGVYTLAEKVIPGHPDKRGYLITRLGSRSMVKIHRAVYTAFYGEILPGEVIRHLNGCPGDNCLSNLAAATQRDNNLDIYAQGGKMKRFTAKEVISIRTRLSQGESRKSIANELGVSWEAITRIAKGVTFAWLREAP